VIASLALAWRRYPLLRRRGHQRELGVQHRARPRALRRRHLHADYPRRLL